jgi:hypothetical protein
LPCEVCGSTLIYYPDRFQCPKCQGFSILEGEEAVRLYGQQVDLARKGWHNFLSEFNRDSLMLDSARKLESYCRNILFSKYSAINLDSLFILAYIVQQASKYCNNRKGKIIDDLDLDKIITTAYKILKIENAYTRLKAGYSTILFKESLTEEKQDTNQMSKFEIVENERYNLMRLTFANHDIFPEELAEQKVSAIVKTIGNEERKYRDFTAKEFISACYDLIVVLYAGLLRSEFYSEVFDLRAYNDILEDPAQLMKLVWNFPIKDNDLTYCPLDLFITRAQTVLRLDKKKVRKYLLFSRNNNIFPLFLVVRLNKKDMVTISHRFAYFVYVILHASVTKSLFDAETERRSLQFEREIVRKEFEKYGYSYTKKPPIKTKTGYLEIDGIATKNGICYVIECKNWRFPAFIEEEREAQETIRKLKGVIEGKKYRRKKGVLVEEKMRSLIEKVNFVKYNMGQFNLDRDKFKEIKGIIVTEDPLPITKYADILIISLNQIATLK